MCAIAVITPVAIAIAQNGPELTVVLQQTLFQSSWQPTTSDDAYMLMIGNVANLRNPLGETQIVGKEVQSVVSTISNDAKTVKDELQPITQLKPYQVGTFDELSKASQTGDGLDIHHWPPKEAASQILPNYNKLTGPAIALPVEEHLSTYPGNYKGDASSITPQELFEGSIKIQ